jgi:hypothetical protein
MELNYRWFRLNNAEGPELRLDGVFGVQPLTERTQITQHGRLAILALADCRQMPNGKQLRSIRGAVEEVQVGRLPIDHIEKVMLGEKYGVDKQWAIELYINLCTTRIERRARRREEMLASICLRYRRERVNDSTEIASGYPTQTSPSSSHDP